MVYDRRRIVRNYLRTWFPCAYAPQSTVPHLQSHDLTWRQLCWIGLWAGFLFLTFNYLWFLGLPMKGMLPSEASAPALVEGLSRIRARLDALESAPPPALPPPVLSGTW